MVYISPLSCLCLRSKLCLPHLKKSKNPHILNISPPLTLKPLWFSRHCGKLTMYIQAVAVLLRISQNFSGAACNAFVNLVASFLFGVFVQFSLFTAFIWSLSLSLILPSSFVPLPLSILNGQVWHVPLCARNGRGVQARGCGCQCPLA